MKISDLLAVLFPVGSPMQLKPDQERTVCHPREQLQKRIGVPGSPHIDDEGRLRLLDALPEISIIVEEGMSILSPARRQFGSVFRDISRQGRKFRAHRGVAAGNGDR